MKKSSPCWNRITPASALAKSVFVLLAVCFSLALLRSPAWAAESKGLAWRKQADSVALLQGGQIIWQFNHGTNETKPCFHPVAVPQGPVLTSYRPEDHPWHRALWFSWKFLNGVNYWEEDRKTGVGEGKTEWRDTRIEIRPDFSARIAADLSYRPVAGSPVLTEQRVIEVSPPNAQGVYHLDWTMTFTAGASEVLLDRTPLPNEPQGKVFGGYAGLSARLVRELESVQAVTSQGPVEFEQGRYRGNAPAMDYAGVIDKREAGIAILDHPQNLNAPSPWYAINDKVMRYFSPAVICYQPHTLKAGQSLTLRYRVLVHPGRWSAERLQAEAKRFASGK